MDTSRIVRAFASDETGAELTSFSVARSESRNQIGKKVLK